MDDKDRKILDRLRKNSRASIRDIAKATRIRPSTVHKRLNELKDKGIIEKFTVKLDNSAVGEDFIVLMMVSTCRDLPKSFFADKRIKEVFGITGEYDLLMKLKFSDIGEFNKYVIDIRKNTAIIKTHTIVATIVLKEEL